MNSPASLWSFCARESPHRLVLFVAGEIDLDAAPLLFHVVDSCARRPVRRVDVDVSRIRFCDVSGLNVLLEAARVSAARGCRLRVRRPTPQMQRLLQVTVTHRLLEVTSASEVLPQDAEPSRDRRSVVLPSTSVPRRVVGRARVRRNRPGEADA
ncbi:STAS domain-containing protein [Streptomyces sp. NPDC057757]|uniref:STAS domain-containing protein n=1 Tax=Streptomyces sp. NPDC057757 TaxID=3346241 RepID=UPI0036C3EF26